jgi:hypothetical protein
VGGSTEVGVGSTAVAGLRQTEVGDSLVELRNCELAWTGVPKLGLGGVVKLRTEHPRPSWGCWDLPGVLGCWDYCDS